jgi:hypothetical protein
MLGVEALIEIGGCGGRSFCSVCACMCLYVCVCGGGMVRKDGSIACDVLEKVMVVVGHDTCVYC